MLPDQRWALTPSTVATSTDSLKVSSGVFDNISSINLSSVETLDMNGLATTMTVARAAHFTTIGDGLCRYRLQRCRLPSTPAMQPSTALANSTTPYHGDSGLSAYNITGGTGADAVNTTVGRLCELWYGCICYVRWRHRLRCAEPTTPLLRSQPVTSPQLRSWYLLTPIPLLHSRLVTIW